MTLKKKKEEGEEVPIQNKFNARLPVLCWTNQLSKNKALLVRVNTFRSAEQMTDKPMLRSEITKRVRDRIV